MRVHHADFGGPRQPFESAMLAVAARLTEVPAPARPQPRSAAPTAARGAHLFEPSGRSLVDFHNAAGSVLLGHMTPQVEHAAAEPGPVGRLRAELSDRLRARHARADVMRLERDPLTALAFAQDCADRATGRRGCITAAEAAADPSLARSVSAVLLDPLADGAGPGQARAARLAADKADAVLILDERRSAFRCQRGGAEALLGVDADIAVYGRSVANGRPLAAICGPRGLLDPTQCLPEACSDAALAAAVATLRLVEAEPVTTALRCRGAEIQAQLEAQIASYGLEGAAAVEGDPTWSRLQFVGDEDGGLQRLWRRSLYAEGVYTQGEHVMSYAHADQEVTALLDAAATAFSTIARLREAAA
jgi:glutamate-1-semialdehyde aminotransferase